MLIRNAIYIIRRRNSRIRHAPLASRLTSRQFRRSLTRGRQKSTRIAPLGRFTGRRLRKSDIKKKKEKKITDAGSATDLSVLAPGRSCFLPAVVISTSSVDEKKRRTFLSSSERRIIDAASRGDAQRVTLPNYFLDECLVQFGKSGDCDTKKRGKINRARGDLRSDNL